MTADKSLQELSLAEKLAAANADIGPISQKGQNRFQHYTFQTEADIKAAVERVCSKYGFIIVPSFQVTKQYERKTKKGDDMYFYDVLGTFTITDGKDKYVGTMPGSGSDTGDKAVQKACTSAQKYFYKQLFNITDKDEDPDATNSKPGGGYQAQPISIPVQSLKKYTEQELLTMQVPYGHVKVNLWTIYNAAFNKNDKESQQWWKHWYERPQTQQGNIVRQYTKLAKEKAKQGEKEMGSKAKPTGD